MRSRGAARPFPRLPLPVILALRYLRSTRRDAFASFLSAVAAGGIALGVAALILVLAVISGFQQALTDQMLARTSQIEVELPAGADPEALRAAALAVAGVEGARLEVFGSGWLVDGGRAQAVDLVGFEGEVPATFPGAAGKPPGLYVGAGRAMVWGLDPGEKLEIVSPRPTLTPLGPQPRVRSLPLAGTFESGTTEAKERVALPREVAETLLGGADRRLEVDAGGFDAALALAPRLAAALPAGAIVRTWRDLNRPLFFALHLEKGMMFVSVALIVLVAALALVADLALVIASKRPEIGMLGAMGASPAAVRRTFLLLGGLLAGFGTATGALVGVAGAFVLDRWRLLPVPGQVYFLDYVPFLVRPGDLFGVLALTLGLALAAALYAAQRAAALTPIEALRR